MIAHDKPVVGSDDYLLEEPQPGTSRAGSLADISPSPEPPHTTNPREQNSDILTLAHEKLS
jgi:hypothetical protein